MTHWRKLYELADDEIYECEYRLRQPDETYRWLRTRSAVFTRANDGQVEQVIGVTRDITAPKQAEEHIKFQANVLSQVSDAVIAVDHAERITYWNAGAERLYGFTADETRGQRLADVNHYRWIKPEDEQNAYADLIAKGMWYGANIHRKKSGEDIYVESAVNVLKDDRGNSIGLLATIHDVTARKRAEEERRTERRYSKRSSTIFPS
jgi:PAS domain S-box-containing protein